MSQTATEVAASAKAGESGRLFGAVTTADIADAIGSKAKVDKRRIQIAQPIKSVGEHEATVRLRDDLTAVITLQVVAAK